MPGICAARPVSGLMIMEAGEGSQVEIISRPGLSACHYL